MTGVRFNIAPTSRFRSFARIRRSQCGKCRLSGKAMRGHPLCEKFFVFRGSAIGTLTLVGARIIQVLRCPLVHENRSGCLNMKIVSHYRDQWERVYTGRRVSKEKADFE
jgi:hypothetical protein